MTMATGLVIVLTPVEGALEAFVVRRLTSGI
jgi:hypothetical protein